MWMGIKMSEDKNFSVEQYMNNYCDVRARLAGQQLELTLRELIEATGKEYELKSCSSMPHWIEIVEKKDE